MAENKKKIEPLEKPAKEGYEAFVGVDPEYRDPNRGAYLTQAEVDAMDAVGQKTDADQHRANQLHHVQVATAVAGYAPEVEDEIVDEDGNKATAKSSDDEEKKAEEKKPEEPSIVQSPVIASK